VVGQPRFSGWPASFDSLALFTFRLPRGILWVVGQPHFSGWPAHFDALGYFSMFRLSGVPSEGGSAVSFQAGPRVSMRWVIFFNAPAVQGSLGGWVSRVFQAGPRVSARGV
jgi:hypothetical protein